MKQFLSILFFLISLLTFAQKQDVYVKGYYRSNGTYVEGHYRTAPNQTINDNYSTQGNVNPYTGKEGTVPREGAYKTTTVKPTQTYKTTTPSYNYSTPTYNSSYPKYNTQPKTTKITRKSTNSHYIY